MNDAPIELNDNNDVHHDDHHLNGVNGNGHINGANSPESPSTPVSHINGSAPKIDIDGSEQESDARHEPVPIKVDKLDNVSTVPQVGTPLDPASIPIAPPHGTPPPQTGELLDDVKMAEEASPGLDEEEIVDNEELKHDVDMVDSQESIPPINGRASSTQPPPSSASSPNTTNGAADHDEERPAKRARKLSDADAASIVHCATPPAASAPTIPPTTASTAHTNGSSTHHHIPSTINTNQFRFCSSTVRTLRKLKDAAPFIKPVDAIALNIPHYHTIIKHPMDFETISAKIQSSNPAKPDSNPSNPRYNNVDEFVADVKLIFRNCETFNGPDHVITQMGKRVEIVFDKMVKQMPPADEPKPLPVVKKPSPLPPPPPPPPPPVVLAPPPVKKAPARRPSTSVPVLRRSEADAANGRPKREIHPPPPRDLPYADGPKRPRKVKVPKDDGTAEQLKFCGRILVELHRKQHYSIASPFYEPVDWVKLEIPSYPKIIKRPMDLSTMRMKLENNEYPNAKKFYDDFKLLCRNCYTFNPPGTPVNHAGLELERLFDDKWKALPPLGSDDEEEPTSEDERQRAIAAMESQIETMRANLAGLKGTTKPKKEKKKEKPAPVASTSKIPKAPKPQPAPPKKKGGKKAAVEEQDVLSFEQKKDLSEAIQKLDGTKLEKVIQIIHEGVPEIRDSTEEIELDIDLLPPSVLTKLYNFVLRPLQRSAGTKRARTGKGTGTGGLKRKSMDEDVEAEKIRQLEARMALFEQGSGGAAAASGAADSSRRTDMSEHSSDSSSDESSGSDTE
ncbi:hypothetical protein JAAARDRAFT_29913 [Jaapia argillacea MUCL 33604]|uniref:Bromodomain-containing protein n=1 Tax=Jaapia argillacea MUCL 33604 TaxID=933084 RepID=A0A067QK09_9AGAM|nr:hypothetical protein JAAARDRAFT_29913 [Jaapia argillacea MUCL 33604]